MPTTYAKNKIHIYNYYKNHPEKIKKIRHNNYAWKKIKIVFFNILL